MKSNLYGKAALVAAVFTLPAWAQFTSGSTGADGALNFANVPPGTTVLFNPSTFNPPLNPAHDNIFNFTTITIPTGVTVRLDASIFTGPVVWLATGAVEIDGTIDLSGGTGGCSTQTICRTLSSAGAGGYPGGLAATATQPAKPGFGPGGGAAGTTTTLAGGGRYTGNAFAVPLIGGSGGGGSPIGGGGGGGGAFLLASSVSIHFSNVGRIVADGAPGANNGAIYIGSGSGGAIRLMAPTVSASGVCPDYNGRGCFLSQLSAQPGAQDATPGVIRAESYGGVTGFVGAGPQSVAGINPPATFGSPGATFVTSTIPPTLRVVSVNGTPVTQPPGGTFQLPDVTINSASPVIVALQASQVPVGTIVNLQFISENGPDINVTSSPLQGSLALSTATVSVTFPTGYTRGIVNATFTQ